MVLVFIIAGMVLRGALDFLVQFLFQLLVVLLCAANIPVLGGVDGLPGHLCAARKEDAAGRKAGHHHENEQNKNAHDHQNVCVAFCRSHKAVYCRTDYTFALVYHLFYTRPCRRCTAGCGFFAASSLRRCAARPGSGIVTFVDFLSLFPSGEPVGTALACAGISCILWCVRLLCRRFCGLGAFLALHFRFLFQLPGIAAFGNIVDGFGGFFPLVQRLHTDIIFLILVDFPVCRRLGGMGGVHLALLRLAQTA